MATEPLVMPKLRGLLHRNPGARLVAIGAARWAGPDELVVGDQAVRVAWCPSPLTVRETLRAAGDGCTLVVTPCNQADLGADVLDRLERHQVLPLDRWQTVRDLFDAHGVDRRVVTTPGLVDTLLDLVPAEGYRPAASGLLDLDTAWRAVVETVLGVDDPADLVRLLLAVHAPGVRADWQRLDAGMQRELAAWLAAAHGAAPAAIVGTLTGSDQVAGPNPGQASAQAPDAIAIGLVCGVVLAHPDRPGGPAGSFGSFASGGPTGSAVPATAGGPGTAGLPEGDAELEAVLERAAVRLERFTGGLRRGDLAAQLWAEAAEAAVDQLQMAAQPILAAAEALLGEIGASDAAERSPVLPGGYAQRLARCAGALDWALVASDPLAVAAALDALDRSVDAVASHRLAGSTVQVEALRMAARLTRRLLLLPAAEPRSFAEAVRLYAEDGGWADLAYARAWDGDTDDHLAAAYHRLLDRVADQREAANRRFAELLVDWVGTGGGEDRVLPIESTLSEVVAPLAAAGHNIAVLVLDGMSVAAAAELFPDVAAHGWTEIVPSAHGPRPLVAAFPTVTRVSRACLLAGELTEGQAYKEKAAFRRHRDLVAASGARKPPVLFHKGDLEGEAGHRFAPEVNEAFADPRQRIVGVVVNAIDDHLAKGQQIAVRWNIGGIGPLHGLLAMAASSRRIVVLCADHGHVIDRGMRLRRGDHGERWRTVGQGVVEPDEVRLSGRRVLAGGGTIVAPWSDDLRYVPRKHGYHGGASPAEVVVPLAVFTTSGFPEGWEEVPPRGPTWWDPLPPAPVAAAPPAGSPGATAGEARGTRASAPAAPDPRGTAPASTGASRSGREAASSPRARRSTPPPPTPVSPTSPSRVDSPAEGRLFPEHVGLAAAPPADRGPASPAPDLIPERSWVQALLGSERYAVQEQRAGRLALQRDRVARVLTELDARGGTMTAAALARAAEIPHSRIGGVVAGLARLLNVEGFAVVTTIEQSVVLDRALLDEQFGLGEGSAR